jgi:hypothetical protein
VAVLLLDQPPEPSAPAIAFDEERLAALLEIRPAVASFHFGLPDRAALDATRAAGCRVLSSARSSAAARSSSANAPRRTDRAVPCHPARLADPDENARRGLTR